MEAPNLYSNNADVKFPLSDVHTEDIPNDILTGLTMSSPADITPMLTGLRVGMGFVFAVFEDLSTGEAVGDVRIDDPVPGIIYPLSMSVPGTGFIMFGPGAVSREGYFSGQVNVALENEVVTRLDTLTGGFGSGFGPGFEILGEYAWGIHVNSLEYGLENVLEMLSNNELITITVEDNVVYIDRNDAAIGDVGRIDLLDRAAGGGEDPRVFSVADTLPDSNGNIDIDLDDCMEKCADVNNLEIGRGDLIAGDAVTLPLDIYFPPKANPDDPCAPSATSSSSSVPEEPTCVNVYKQVILNEDTDAVGTLYTHESPSGSSSGSDVPQGSSSGSGVPQGSDVPQGSSSGSGVPQGGFGPGFGPGFDV